MYFAININQIIIIYALGNDAMGTNICLLKWKFVKCYNKLITFNLNSH